MLLRLSTQLTVIRGAEMTMAMPRLDRLFATDRGEGLTAAWTFELELHGHQIFVQEKFIFNGVLAVGASTNFTAGPLG